MLNVHLKHVISVQSFVFSIFK